MASNAEIGPKDIFETASNKFHLCDLCASSEAGGEYILDYSTLFGAFYLSDSKE